MQDLDFTESTILVTGGTGSFGKAFVAYALERLKPRKLIIFSRDELKQFEMQQIYPPNLYPNIRFFIGDVRDRERLYRALSGVDCVIHAAALKQVTTAEYNPLEAIKTNVIGAANIVDAAIDCDVKSVIALSTDKAAQPVNLYGATKLCADKLFVAANSYSGVHNTQFSVVRYGNVAGSRGSIIPVFLSQREQGTLTITDERMTRFIITLEQATRFVVDCAGRMSGGEIFVPKIPSVRIMDLARCIGPDCDYRTIGIRPGEKLHELLIGSDEAHLTVEYDDYYVIHSPNFVGEGASDDKGSIGRPCDDGFSYSSEENTTWLESQGLDQLIALYSGTTEG
jgi:UDP-N-acetylglucosamine 4,6-dehydratase/5-epimerase